MAITRQKKEEILAKMEGIAKDSATVVFAQFKRLPVNEQNEMRKALREQSVGYTVAKKSLVRRAFTATAISGDMPDLAGEVSVIYSKDALAPARELAVFVKKFPEQLAFAGGVFGGAYVNASEVRAIAAIPGLQTLRAQFVQLINSPRQRLATVFHEQAKKQG